MRSLNECQAEVFRRSEKRIRKRKQHRKHILAVCIPFVMCITLFSAYILPATLPTGANESCQTEPAVATVAEDASYSSSCSVVQIDISGPALSLSCTEPADIAQILSLLSTSEANAVGSINNSVRGEISKETAAGTDSFPGIKSDSADIGFTISLITREGSKTEYCLTGNTLTNRTTGQVSTLSQTQTNELKDLLGIPRP